MKILNYFSLIEINDPSRGISQDKELLKQITATLLAEKFEMYQGNSTAQIQEFENSGWLKVVEGLVGIKDGK